MNDTIQITAFKRTRKSPLSSSCCCSFFEPLTLSRIAVSAIAFLALFNNVNIVASSKSFTAMNKMKHSRLMHQGFKQFSSSSSSRRRMITATTAASHSYSLSTLSRLIKTTTTTATTAFLHHSHYHYYPCSNSKQIYSISSVSCNRYDNDHHHRMTTRSFWNNHRYVCTNHVQFGKTQRWSSSSSSSSVLRASFSSNSDEKQKISIDSDDYEEEEDELDEEDLLQSSLNNIINNNNNNKDNEDDDDDIKQYNTLDYTTLRQNSTTITSSLSSPSSSLSSLPQGKPLGFYVISQYNVPSTGFTNLSHFYTMEEQNRLSLEKDNVTLPVALTLLDSDNYPSLSRARKACRKGAILLHRGPLKKDPITNESSVFDPDKCIRGRVGDRVYPQDVIGKQVRMGGGFYPSLSHEKPPFDLPVIYEDDHFAIVNKPAGVVVYSHRKGGHGTMTVRAALPFVLRPPSIGTVSIIRRPQAVHRLDKPTSGLLLIAKTKPAMVDLTRQFVERNIKKTYTAIVNGIPDEPSETSITSLEAHDLGVDIDIIDNGIGNDEEKNDKWQLINHTLDDKSAVTVWRTLRQCKSLEGTDNYVTMVELKPKTGRFHQLRRHMAWVRDCPVIGDSVYDHRNFKDEDLYLCSNKVTLDHPYYNTELGRKEWEAMEDEDKKYGNGMIRLSEDEDDKGEKTVQVHATIDLPEKFSKFLDRSEGKVVQFLDKEK